MDNDTTALIQELYREGEISEYAVGKLLDDESIDRSAAETTPSPPTAGGRTGEDDGESVWTDDAPMPYGHLPEDEYYTAD
jgi:hypothetical protein